MNQYLGEFLTIAGIHFLAVASPGPDFAIMLRQSVTFGRRTGVWTSLGIGMGIFVHVAYCILGLGLLISKSILAFNIAKYLGAAYLVYIGIKALGAKETSVNQNSELRSLQTPSSKESFALGFLTNALNPKATLFFLSVFSVVVSPQTPSTVQVGYGVWMAIATAIWFSSLSVVFSKEKVRSSFQRLGHWFERTMGALLVGLGIKLALVQSK